MGVCPKGVTVHGVIFPVKATEGAVDDGTGNILAMSKMDLGTLTGVQHCLSLKPGATSLRKWDSAKQTECRRDERELTGPSQYSARWLQPGAD